MERLRPLLRDWFGTGSFRIFVHTLALYFVLTLVLRSIFWVKNWSMWQTLTTGEFARAVSYGLRFDLSISAIITCAALLLHCWLWLLRVRRHGWVLSRLLPGMALVLLMAGDAMYFVKGSVLDIDT